MVRGLRPALAGRRLRAVEVHDPFLLQGCDAEEFAGRLAGARVEGVERRGKWVVIALGGRPGIDRHPAPDDGRLLARAARPSRPRAPDVPCGRAGARRSGFATTDGWARSPGTPAPPRPRRAFARSHGPDALEIDRDDLAGRLARTARGIKPTLMDQKVLAGIGNIYADEILFRARLHPERPASALVGGRGRPAPRGDRRGPGRGDRGGGVELRRRLPDGARPGGGLPGPERDVRPGRPALPGVRQGRS